MLLRRKKEVGNNQKIAPLIATLALCLLFLSFQPGSPVPLLPLPLREQLRQDQTKDSLTAWIYRQIQWVVKAPAARATLLTRAVATAWRSPRSNEEIQAWQDLLSNEGYALLMG